MECPALVLQLLILAVVSCKLRIFLSESSCRELYTIYVPHDKKDKGKKLSHFAAHIVLDKK